MKKLFFVTFSVASILITACGSASTETAASKDSSSVMAQDTATEKSYDIALVDNKKDPSCGMPVTAGISDTAHYENKVLGFCSTECKNEFLKNPRANIAAAELK